jgi:RNA polymerase sigma-70 factor (ECF subfamily)
MELRGDPADAGRRQAFLELLEAHGPALLRLSAAYTDSAADREDLFQDICLALWRALPRFRGECSLRTFVYRVGHNRGLTFRSRSRWREQHLDWAFAGVPEVPSGERPADEVVDARDRLAALLAAVRGLPPLQREVMVLRLEGLETPEIAAVLGITENNTAVRLSRARAALRERLPHLAET